ncbi:JAB domain-containing protein [Thiohalomonas denitrificans]|uniref:JAB domain-containing protein n=1 Tax=Thiohalomonas denitrificans TaxID=415747 RepID=UPI0026F31460|nr:JAB domain-containing protein [Thiohalomonas denitrificans]
MGQIKRLKLSFERKRVDDDLLHEALESAEQAYRLFKEMENDVREKVVCLHLTDKYEIISFEVVSIGTQTYAIADPVEILRGAVLVQASKIIILHNHPLGSPEPSDADIKGARNLKEKGAVLNIELRDAIVIGDGGFVSLAERELI